MAGADSRAVIAMEVLIEEQIVAPVGIVAELRGIAENGTAAALVLAEDRHQPGGQLASHFEERHGPAGSRRTVDFEAVPEILVKAQEGADNQDVDREPDRSSPIRIAAEHAGSRLRGFVRNF